MNARRCEWLVKKSSKEIYATNEGEVFFTWKKKIIIFILFPRDIIYNLNLNICMNAHNYRYMTNEIFLLKCLRICSFEFLMNKD
jgi:hypothetical protein